MVFEIYMPDPGTDISDGSILEWKKGLGDSVHKGETICEVEAEKAVLDVAAPGDGVLRLVFAEVGVSLPPGTLLAVVANAGEDLSSYQV